MDDGSSSILKSLRNDWALLWGNFLGQADASSADHKSEALSDKTFEADDIRGINAEELAIVARVLSQRRKTLNQKLESINREIEDNSAKLETIRLVGGEDELTLNRISTLTDLGLSVNNELSKIDEKLSLARAREQELYQELVEE